MTDGFSLILPNYPVDFFTNPLLDFDNLVSMSTGEIKGKMTEFYKGIFIKLNNGKAFMRGSFDNYAHYPNGNSGQFYFTCLLNALDSFENELKIDASKCILRSFEIPINLILNHSPDLFLNGLIDYKGGRFNDEYYKGWHSRRSRHSAFDLKAYNKSRPNDGLDNILRFECAFNKMEPVKRFGMVKLSDFRDKSKLYDLGYNLIDKFKAVFFYDYGIDISALPTKTQNYLLQGQNHVYWERLLKDNKSTWKTYRKRYRDKVIECANRDLLSDYAKIMEKQLIDLLEYPNKKLDCPLIDPLSKWSVRGQRPIAIENTNTIVSWSIGGQNQNHSENLFTEPDPPRPENWTENKTESDQYENLPNRGRLEVIAQPENLFTRPITILADEEQPEDWTHDITELERYFSTVQLPDKPFKVNRWTTIIDVNTFLESSFATVKNYNGRPKFKPYLNQIIELRNYLNTYQN